MIALGSDHGGYELKCQVMEHLRKEGFPVGILDVLTNSPAIIRILERRRPGPWRMESAKRES